MDWEEISDAMLEGLIIARQAWPNGVVIYPNMTVGRFRCSEGWELTPEDVDADDWYIWGTVQ